MICSASARKIGVVAAGALGVIGALCVSDDAVVVPSEELEVEAGASSAELGAAAATLSAVRVSLLPEEYAIEANKLPTPMRAKAMPSRIVVYPPRGPRESLLITVNYAWPRPFPSVEQNNFFTYYEKYRLLSRVFSGSGNDRDGRPRSLPFGRHIPLATDAEEGWTYRQKPRPTLWRESTLTSPSRGTGNTYSGQQNSTRQSLVTCSAIHSQLICSSRAAISGRSSN